MQLKSETCFLKDVVWNSFSKRYKTTKSEKTVESFRKRRNMKGKIEKEKRKGPREKSKTTSAKEWSRDKMERSNIGDEKSS